ncbi:Glutaredoxin [Handroanthus impetiginosus]|uniref:Glutaredoxin n=1 Tax=Handroanthus impetiginosus TaxID=429701 RepID=A0A2G9GJB4_9LAMI|nr:Glutaredoxin [Handroanthus impetiginosus]
MDTVARLTAEKPVVIFSKSTCCMCHTIKTLISSFGANPTVYELDELPNGQQLEKSLVAALGRLPSFPVVFIGQELVGGDNEVMSLHVKGKLVPLLKQAKAIWV